MPKDPKDYLPDLDTVREVTDRDRADGAHRRALEEQRKAKGKGGRARVNNEPPPAAVPAGRGPGAFWTKGRIMAAAAGSVLLPVTVAVALLSPGRPRGDGSAAGASVAGASVAGASAAGASAAGASVAGASAPQATAIASTSASTGAEVDGSAPNASSAATGTSAPQATGAASTPSPSGVPNVRTAAPRTPLPPHAPPKGSSAPKPAGEPSAAPTMTATAAPKPTARSTEPLLNE